MLISLNAFELLSDSFIWEPRDKERISILLFWDLSWLWLLTAVQSKQVYSMHFWLVAVTHVFFYSMIGFYYSFVLLFLFVSIQSETHITQSTHWLRAHFYFVVFSLSLIFVVFYVHHKLPNIEVEKKKYCKPILCLVFDVFGTIYFCLKFAFFSSSCCY